MRCLSANMHRGQQTLLSDWGTCKKVGYKEAADFFSSQANSACYPGGIHISGLFHRCHAELHRAPLLTFISDGLFLRKWLDFSSK